MPRTGKGSVYGSCGDAPTKASVSAAASSRVSSAGSVIGCSPLSACLSPEHGPVAHNVQQKLGTVGRLHSRCAPLLLDLYRLTGWEVDMAPASDIGAPLDVLDARLITLLSEEPRIGVLECSRRLGVARGTVQARLDRLQGRGIIQGFGPQLSPAALGYGVT